MADYLNNNAGMDWDDAIENDGQEFIILPEGDYNFTVTDFERGRFPGSAKMSPCNKATLTLQVKTEDGIASIRTDLILNRLVEFRISAFFRCIGQKKHGEPLKMNWQLVPGSSGKCKVGIRTYNGNDYNEIKKFLEPEEKAATAPLPGFAPPKFS